MYELWVPDRTNTTNVSQKDNHSKGRFNKPTRLFTWKKYLGMNSVPAKKNNDNLIFLDSSRGRDLRNKIKSTQAKQ